MKLSGRARRRERLLRHIVIACLAAVGICAFHARAGYVFTTVDDPLGVETEVTGISGSVAVGSYYEGSGAENGFIYNGSAFTTLDDPLGVGGTQVLGISGNLIVGSYTDASGVLHGFIYNGSTFTTLDDPSAAQVPSGYGTVATGVYGSTVVGYYYDASGNEHGFVYSGSSFATLNFPSGTDTVPSGVYGNIVVGTYQEGDLSHGFAYNGSIYATVDDPLHDENLVTGIWGSTIVGASADDAELKFDGYLYDSDTSTFTTFDDPLGVMGTVPYGISGTTIVGTYVDARYVYHGFIATDVPEPACLPPLLLGALAMARRRRCQRG